MLIAICIVLIVLKSDVNGRMLKVCSRCSLYGVIGILTSWKGAEEYIHQTFDKNNINMGIALVFYFL